MGTRWKFIGFCLSYHSPSVAHLDQHLSWFGTVDESRLEVRHHYSKEGIVNDLEILSFGFEKIEHLFIIDFQIAEWEFGVVEILCVDADMFQRELNESVMIMVSKHGMAFACSCDAIGEDGGVDAIEVVV